MRELIVKLPFSRTIVVEYTAHGEEIEWFCLDRPQGLIDPLERTLINAACQRDLQKRRQAWSLRKRLSA